MDDADVERFCWCCNNELLLDEDRFVLWVVARMVVGSPLPLPSRQCSERFDRESLSESMMYALPSALYTILP